MNEQVQQTEFEMEQKFAKYLSAINLINAETIFVVVNKRNYIYTFKSVRKRLKIYHVKFTDDTQNKIINIKPHQRPHFLVFIPILLITTDVKCQKEPLRPSCWVFSTGYSKDTYLFDDIMTPWKIVCAW